MLVSIKLRNWNGTHRSWDKETREEIKESIECCCKDWCHLVVWCDGHSHHSIICEVQEREEADKEEPKELLHFPFKAHHCIHYEWVINSLEKHIWYFTKDLQLKMHWHKDNVTRQWHHNKQWTLENKIILWSKSICLPVLRHKAKEHTFRQLFLDRTLFFQRLQLVEQFDNC